MEGKQLYRIFKVIEDSDWANNQIRHTKEHKNTKAVVKCKCMIKLKNSIL